MLKENLEKEIEVLASMIQAFQGLESAVVSKDVDMISKHSLAVEELSLILEQVHNEREQILKTLKIRTVKDYIDMGLDDGAQDISVLSVKVIEKLNELIIVMDGIRQIIEFNSQYAELLNNLLKGVQSPTYDFSKNRQSGHLGNGVYKPVEGNARYDSRK